MNMETGKLHLFTIGNYRTAKPKDRVFIQTLVMHNVSFLSRLVQTETEHLKP